MVPCGERKSNGGCQGGVQATLLSPVQVRWSSPQHALATAATLPMPPPRQPSPAVASCLTRMLSSSIPSMAAVELLESSAAGRLWGSGERKGADDRAAAAGRCDAGMGTLVDAGGCGGSGEGSADGGGGLNVGGEEERDSSPPVQGKD